MYQQDHLFVDGVYQGKLLMMHCSDAADTMLLVPISDLILDSCINGACTGCTE